MSAPSLWLICGRVNFAYHISNRVPPYTAFTVVVCFLNARMSSTSRLAGRRVGSCFKIKKSFGLDTQWLSYHRVSNNVGSVKRFWGALARALRRARHFALVEGFTFALASKRPLDARNGNSKHSSQ